MDALLCNTREINAPLNILHEPSASDGCCKPSISFHSDSSIATVDTVWGRSTFTQVYWLWCCFAAWFSNRPFPRVSLPTLCRAKPDALMAALHSFSTPEKSERLRKHRAERGKDPGPFMSPSIHEIEDAWYSRAWSPITAIRAAILELLGLPQDDSDF